MKIGVYDSKFDLFSLFIGKKNFNIFLILSILIIVVQMYLNTGTLSGYAVTIDNPLLAEGYIHNYDYTHYKCNYNFIVGEPLNQWEQGWVLRRILFYILSYPFFKLFGFYDGGILGAFIITIVAFYSFIKFIYRRIGEKQSYVAMALLATYPGIMYWIGSPFSQIMIVPCCCWIYMIMWKMNDTNKISNHVLYLSLIAILFTAYDLFIFFYPAILLIYFRKKDWLKLLISFPIMIIPQWMIIIWLKSSGLNEFHSENTGLYLTIIKSYISPADLQAWGKLIVEVPFIFINNFFDSNFWILPVLFLIIFLWGRLLKFPFNNIEYSILLSALLVFLFNNMAPNYVAGFQLRGNWIARLYQPVFIVLIMYVVRFSSIAFDFKLRQKRAFLLLVVVCCIGNVILNTGVSLNSRLTQYAWYHFYKHSSPDAMQKNLKLFGVHPVGQPNKKLISNVP